MVGRLAGFGLCRRRGRQRAGAGPGRRRSAACEERALEKAAPFAVEIVEKLLPMKLKVWAGVIVSCAHDYVPPWWSIETPAVQPVTPGRNGNLHANRQVKLGHSAAEA